MTAPARRVFGLILAALVSSGLAGCDDDGTANREPPDSSKTRPAGGEGSLAKEGPAALAPLLGRWATRPEHCAAASPEAGALMDIADTGLTSGSMTCSFGKIARHGPRYDITGNCSAEASGPVPDERLIFVFTSADRFEWRSEEDVVQLAYLRCPR